MTTVTTPLASSLLDSLRQASLLGNSEFMGYFNKYPDLQTEWRRISSDGTAARRGWTSPEQYAQWHWQTTGQAEGRTLTPTDPISSPTLTDVAGLTSDEQAGTRVPQRSDTEIQETARLARMREQRRGGRGSTLLTGGAGLTGQFQASRPRLSGILG